MGFRNGAYATVWSIEPVSNTFVKGRISISRKNKETGEYEQDFSGFVSFFGTSAAAKAMRLKEKDRIKLNEVDTRTYYDKEKDRTYYNFNIYDFDIAEPFGNNNGGQQNNGNLGYNGGGNFQFDGGMDFDDSNGRLPF